MLITLTEYARMVGRSERTVRQKAESGLFNTARKSGWILLIDSEEPYVDGRRKEHKRTTKKEAP